MEKNDLVEAVRMAVHHGTPLAIKAGGTRDFLGPVSTAQKTLDVTGLKGIISYEPTELVIRAHAGTLLSDVEALLAENNQMLPFEPPSYGAQATIGGVVASGLAGPRRIQLGAVRDSLLGIGLINGKGEALEFGGQVMKNVAGYDLSRLMAGAFGTLGLITDCSIKVLPVPEEELTLSFEMDRSSAIRIASDWGARPWPVSGFWWAHGHLYARLSGTNEGLRAVLDHMHGRPIVETPWDEVREHKHEYFRLVEGEQLWRLSLPPAAPTPELSGEWALEWGGALRWLKTDQPLAKVHEKIAELGGSAQLWYGKGASNAIRLTAAELLIHKRLKRALDPDGIFNPGRLHPDF